MLIIIEIAINELFFLLKIKIHEQNPHLTTDIIWIHFQLVFVRNSFECRTLHTHLLLVLEWVFIWFLIDSLLSFTICRIRKICRKKTKWKCSICVWEVLSLNSADCKNFRWGMENIAIKTFWCCNSKEEFTAWLNEIFPTKQISFY